MTTTEKLNTVEEFLALPEDMIHGCELIDGRIIKKHIWEGGDMGMTPAMFGHAQVIRLVWRVLDGAAEQRHLGITLVGPSISVGANRDRTRLPDLAIFTGEPPTKPDEVLALMPILAVEVISPSNTADDMFAKVEEYLAAGVRLVWQVFPQPRTVIAYWPDRTVVFRPGDTITAEPVLPGFSCPVADLFPPPASPAQ